MKRFRFEDCSKTGYGFSIEKKAVLLSDHAPAAEGAAQVTALLAVGGQQMQVKAQRLTAGSQLPGAGQTGTDAHQAVVQAAAADGVQVGPHVEGGGIRTAAVQQAVDVAHRVDPAFQTGGLHVRHQLVGRLPVGGGEGHPGVGAVLIAAEPAQAEHLLLQKAHLHGKPSPLTRGSGQ